MSSGTQRHSFALLRRQNVAALAALVAAALLAIVWGYRAMAQSNEYHRQLSQMGEVLSALAWFDQTIGRLPDAQKRARSGDVLFSWRVSILPYREGLGERALDLESPWTSDSNRSLAMKTDRIYCFARRSKHGSLACNVAAVIGPGTPFQDKQSMALADVPCDTILFVEAKNATTHWMAAGDLRLDQLDQALTGGTDGTGFVAVFADGEVWFLDRRVPIDVVKRFLLAIPSGPRNRKDELGGYRLYSVSNRHHRCKESK